MKKIFLIAMSILLLNCDFALAQEKTNKDISTQSIEETKVASVDGVENEKPKKKKSSKKGKKNKKVKTGNNRQ